jgi:CRP/FNR family transcriptional regulator, cyclic AMP receptor protein
VTSQTETSLRATLAQMPLFAELDEPERQHLAGRFRARTYRKGETIFLRGDPGESFYVVESGRVKIGLASPDGKEMILSLFGPGDFFGELALLDGAPRSADAVAVEPCRLQLLQRADFRAFLMAHPEVPFRLLAALTRLLRHNAEIIEDAAFLDIPARLARVLLQLAASRPEGSEPLVISSRLTQANLAGLVGATRESVNRWLRFFERQGIIRAEGGQITILRPDALRRRIY